jgi:hypothetical protein
LTWQENIDLLYIQFYGLFSYGYFLAVSPVPVPMAGTVRVDIVRP